MSERVLSQTYPTYDEAVQAIYELEQAGFPAENISMVGADSDPRMSDQVTRDVADNPAAVGATIGATAGGGIGLLAGLGAITFPGIGPVVAAGWFVAGVAGAGIGAALGGLVGALGRIGITSSQAHHVAEVIQRGGHAVLVRTDDAELDTARAILRHDQRMQARKFATLSPIVAFETGDVDIDRGDYSDEAREIERAQERIENG